LNAEFLPSLRDFAFAAFAGVLKELTEPLAADHVSTC
jgi:hypothetical protein